ncbi:AAA family ATPase [Paenibacillus methanolicus]|uniref:AAA family ATPase n=1 Tax=Paenibacillus methanolicus TaxID=582686 RepID=UPI0011E80828|nr:shikimate kinase [Paenibacillus methanolicus]
MKRLVFVLGAAGAGKTTVAKALASKRGSAFFDMDTLLRPAAEAIMTLQGLDPDDRDSAAYKALCRDLGYRITMDAALENVGLGIESFVIGPFTKETADSSWLARELDRIGESPEGVDVKVLFVTLPGEADYRDRIVSRGSKLDDWKLANWDTFAASLAPRQVAWPLRLEAVMRFDNAGPLTVEKLSVLERLLDL